jgi:predicted permease
MFARLRSLWQSLWHRAQFENELDEEMRAHMEARTDDLVRSGLARDEATRRARIEFGCVEAHQDGVRESRRLNWFEDLAQDLRFGLRMLRRSPGFTAVAILTLALGIGANTAMFSIINAVALRQLPVHDPQQLVLLEWTARKKPTVHAFVRFGGCPGDSQRSASLVSGCSVSYPMFEQAHAAHDVFSGVFAFAVANKAIKIGDRPTQRRGMFVSGEFFSTLGAKTALGRPLDPSDDVPGATPVIVLSDHYWRTELNSDPAVLEKTALINRQPFRIVGVTGYNFPELDAGTPIDFWLPLVYADTIAPRPTQTDGASLWLDVIGRLRQGITQRRAEAEINARLIPNATAGPVPLFKPSDEPRLLLPSAATGLASLRTVFGKPLFVLMTIVGLILLLTCANVAGLMLARASARQKEMAVRRTLGAGRWRIIRQLLTESILLSVAGGAFGILFARVAAKSLVTFLSNNWFFPLQIDTAIDWHVLIFTMAISMVVGIIFGLAPALHNSRVDVAPALGRAHASSDRKQPSRLGRVLVVAQVAISILVLVGAALLGRTLVNLETTATGFKPDGLLLFELDMRAGGVSLDDPRVDQINQGLRNRLSALPGVVSASYSSDALLAGGSSATRVNLPGEPPFAVDTLAVGPAFFETMRIPLVAGRTFTQADFVSPAKPTPIIVNRTFSRNIFGDGSPLGRALTEAGGQPVQLQVIGVVGDTKYDSLRDDMRPMIFMPDTYPFPVFELRTQGDPKALTSMVYDAVGSVNHDFLVLHMMTQTEQIDRNIFQERLVAALSILFGLLGLLLACIGLYGIVAYGVIRRTHEIGVRMALGAQTDEMMWLTARQGLGLTLAGVAIGLAIAAGLTRYLGTLLFGVRPVDPLTFGAVSLLLGSVAFLACYIPARRAMRVDPMVALRHE